MYGKNQIPDKELLKNVTRRMQRSGSSSRITASVRSGNVTLIGKLQYENQRAPLLKTVQAVAGVRQVIDQLQSPPSKRPHAT